jgi:hypothetical protein
MNQSRRRLPLWLLVAIAAQMRPFQPPSERGTYHDDEADSMTPTLREDLTWQLHRRDAERLFFKHKRRQL